MSISTEEDNSTRRLTTELICAVYGAEPDGCMRTPAELRLSVLEWVLDLEVDPSMAARTILEHRSHSHAAALPQGVIALLEQIAAVDLKRLERSRRIPRSV